MSDNPSSNDAPASNLPTSDLPYGVNTIVIPFTWSGPQRRRLPWPRFSGFDNMARAVNTNDPNAQARWDTYRHALRAFNAGR